MQRVPPELTASARRLRRDATDVEHRLWQHLRGRRPRFTRQYVIGHYVVDFACRSTKIAIELDGGQHAERKAEDAERTAYLESCGWTVLRFWNNEFVDNPDGVVEAILRAVAQASTHPQPLPFREGS